MSQDPTDPPAGGARPGETEAAAGLEPPPEAGAAEQLERRARLAEDRLTEVLAAYRKVRTENEGFRERVSREAERQAQRRRERLLLKFIEILDNLDRALEAAEFTNAGNPLVEGLILVRSQLLQTLQQEGLERVPVLGLPFDPAVAEAVSLQPVSDPENDQVVMRELLRGYRLHGRVARPSRVIIGSYSPEAAAPAPARDPVDDPLVGEEPSAAEAESVAETITLDTSADTLPLDETTLREIFGEPGEGDGQ